MSSGGGSTSKVAQDLLVKSAKQAGFSPDLDETITGYIGDLFASWFTDGHGLEEFLASLNPILGSCGLDEAAIDSFIDGLDKAFSVKGRHGLGPQITAVVPIETPVQMSLSPITAQMADEPRRVQLDWLSSKRVVASQVDRSKLEKAEQKLKNKAMLRKGLTDDRSGPMGLDYAMPVAKKLTDEEIVNAMIAEESESAAAYGGGRNRRDLHVESFDISLGGRRILTGASLMIAQGRRYGLIGRNGIGKSTLLRHIAGRMLDGLPEGLSILHVEQEVIGDETSAIKSVLQADFKREALLSEESRLTAILHDTSSMSPEASKRASDRLQLVYKLLQDMDNSDAEARACTILSGLGFAPTDYQRATKEFSGGWRMRLALARALFCRPDLLLLDEPTNMLDFPAVVWLETHLREWAGTLLVVSHDRYFLDGVVTDIIHMHDEQLEVYRGDYNQFLSTRADRQKSQQREYEAQMLYRANLQAFIDRWRYNANRAPQAQSRLKVLEKLPELKPVVLDAPVVFRFPPVDYLPAPIIQASMASFSYPTAKAGAPPLLQDIDINIQLDTRMAIVGPNGAGKTTLLKLLIGKLDPVSGMVTVNSRLRIGYFSQHHIDQLDVNMNSLQVLQSRFPGKSDEEYRAQLGAFGLSGPLSLQTIKTLSGGQKSRAVFAALCMQSPHLMILDEPTNHLDMDSIDALINALKVYQGGVVAVSHDKKFIDALCSEIWVCKEAHFSRFEGSIHEYSRSLIAGMGKLTH